MMPIDDSKRVRLLGTFLDCLTMEQTLQYIEVIIALREQVQHVVINASKVNLINKDEKLKKLLRIVHLLMRMVSQLFGLQGF